MYSGDEFYGDDVTSPLVRPVAQEVWTVERHAERPDSELRIFRGEYRAMFCRYYTIVANARSGYVKLIRPDGTVMEESSFR